MQSRPDLNNHAGDLAPKHSVYFDAFTANRAHLAAQYNPLQGPQMGPKGTVGVVRPKAASEMPLVGSSGYFGDAPSSLQAIIKALPPWLRR